MKPNCALDRPTVLCLYGPGFQRQVPEHIKFLSERSKKMKEQRERHCCEIRSQLTKFTVYQKSSGISAIVTLIVDLFLSAKLPLL